MSEMSRRFNFDDFDKQIADALEEHYAIDLEMLEQSDKWVDELKWRDHDRVFYPGQIGAVVCSFEREPDDAAQEAKKK